MAIEDLKKKNVKKGDLVLLVDYDPEHPSPLVLAIFNHFKESPMTRFVVDKAVQIYSPERLGDRIAIPCNRILYKEELLGVADRIYVGEEEIIRGLKREPTMAPYAAFIKTHLKYIKKK